MNVNVLSDKMLLNSYLSGDRSAMSQLIERHSRRVRDYIRMMVKDNDEGRYTDSGKFLSWVLRIAHNRVLDYFRAQKQSKQVNESEAGYNILGTMRFAEPTVEDELVRRLIELLPDEQRQVVMMRYYSKMSFQEIADQTDVSINTALGRMRYALINLRRMIKEKNLVLS